MGSPFLLVPQCQVFFIHSYIFDNIKKIPSRSVIHSTLFSCKEFGESGDSGEFDDFGEPSDSGESVDSGESGDFSESGDSCESGDHVKSGSSC